MVAERAYRGITADPNRARVAVRVGAVATLSYPINRDNPLKALEEWDRDTHWHVFNQPSRRSSLRPDRRGLVIWD